MDGTFNGKTSARPGPSRRSASDALRTPIRSGSPQKRRTPAVSDPSPRADGPEIGRLVGIDPTGSGLVDHSRNALGSPLAARSVVPLTAELIGREVVLMFEQGDLRKPIVMGIVQEPSPPPPESAATSRLQCVAAVDGQQLLFTAEQEIVLRCGEASLTLTRAGKVLIRGSYVLSRSSGANCIKGGSIQLN